MQKTIDRIISILFRNPEYTEKYGTVKNLKYVILSTYMNEMKKDPQKSATRSYPVAQSRARVDDIDGLYNNVYALINVLKWLWISFFMRSGKECRISKFFNICIEAIQQNVIQFTEVL